MKDFILERLKKMSLSYVVELAASVCLILSLLGVRMNLDFSTVYIPQNILDFCSHPDIAMLLFVIYWCVMDILFKQMIRIGSINMNNVVKCTETRIYITNSIGFVYAVYNLAFCVFLSGGLIGGFGSVDKKSMIMIIVSGAWLLYQVYFLVQYEYLEKRSNNK